MNPATTTVDWLRVRTQADPGEVLGALRGMYGTLGHALTLGKPGRGLLGFQRGIPVMLADVPLGRMDWGGESQRGWLRLDLPGTGCGFVQDWDAVGDIEQLPNAQLRRLDIALTTWHGEVKHDTVIDAHTRGEFNTGGRPPNLQVITHTDERRGKTCYVGSRTGDKFFRAYEKGKQLAERMPEAFTCTHIDGSPVDDIYRCELELKAGGTDLPWETVDRRDQYFAGAYPFCARVLPGIEPDILQRRPERIPQRELQAHLAMIRHQAGKALFTACAAYGGDVMRVWDQIVGNEHHRGLLEAGVLLVDHE